MIDTYISSSIAYRNKGSSSFSEFCLLNARLHSSCSSWGEFSIHGVTMNPRLLYALRQSTLIHWSASKRMILSANGYCRFLGVGEPDRACLVLCPQKERRVACLRWERCKSDLGHEGNVHEMLSLLTDIGGDCIRERNGKLSGESLINTDICKQGVRKIEKKGRLNDHSRKEKYVELDSLGITSKREDCVRVRNSKLGGESLRTADICRQGICKIEKKGRLNDHSSKEEECAELDSFRSSSKSGVGIKSVERYRGTRRDDSLREDILVGRKNGSSSSYYSVSSGGDIETSVDLISKADRRFPGKKDAWLMVNSEDDLHINHRKVIGESSNDYKNYSRQGRVDAFEGKFEQFQRYEDDKHCGESLKKINATVDRVNEESMGRNNRLKSDIMVSDSEWASMKEPENLTEPLEFSDSDTQRASTSQMLSKMRMKDREENSTSSVNLFHGTRENFTQRDQKVVGLTESRHESQNLMNISVICEDNTERASSNQKLVNTQLKYRKENTTSDVNLVAEGSRQFSKSDQPVIGQTESRKQSQQVSKISNSDIERTTSSRKHLRTTLDDRQQDSTSNTNLVQEASAQRTQTDQQLFRQTESRNESQKLTTISEIHLRGAERASSSQKLFETRINDQEENYREENLTSVVNKVQEAREHHNIKEERFVGRLGSSKESERLTKRLESYQSDTERAFSSQGVLNIKMKDREAKSMPVPHSEARKLQICSSNEEERTLRVMVTPSQSQTAARGSTIELEPTAYETKEGVSNTLYTHLHDVNDRTGRDEICEQHSELVVNDDALGSANRLDTSSTEFVGEFVDKVRQDISTSEDLTMESRHTSEIQKARTSSETNSTSQQSILDATVASKDEKYIQHNLSQYISEEFQVKEHGSSQSSPGTGTKGPSDKMWDVVGPSSQEPSGRGAAERGSSNVKLAEPTSPSNDGNALVRRSGRSLWSYIGDMFRKGWGAKSSSHESLTSEDWFSDHVPDDYGDENVKKGRRGIPKEPLLIKKSVDLTHPKTTPAQSQEASEGTSLRDKITQLEVSTSTSMGTLESGSKFRSPLSHGEENVGWIEDEKRRQVIPSSVVIVGSSLPSVGSSTSFANRLTTVIDKGEISESGKVQVPGSGFTELHEEPIDKTTKTSGTEKKDGELTQRKLKRSNQVVKERFDEWEEAFKLENEQRKIDEMFMREALLEAKKAADTWEVPVGAVLVQGGKIIARGCNLVEELRDSTAHAEMICIRDASNLLRTWRLAGTTLYVTLEPCPMCAGAILQARIDAVVWGAPNKLLGADGSWVSLFPSGEEGRNGSDLSDRTAGPIHPFHPKITIRRGILATECSDAMQQFFQLRRRKNKKQDHPSPSCLPVSTNPTKFFTKMRHIFTIMFCL
ncbi:tRNA(adenine(34)) deaminase, chloroplastic-like [Tasmannia lanceolata]|uniref:tRNA(adenine(34)) deaminase, chloroplastic-like n=1 Tax=Tasmannia lanceolata TaxID=3420 RepID=UPI00406499D0